MKNIVIAIMVMFLLTACGSSIVDSGELHVIEARINNTGWNVDSKYYYKVIDRNGTSTFELYTDVVYHVNDVLIISKK